MTAASPPAPDVIDEIAFHSYQAFQNRMMEIEQLLKAADARATVDYIGESLAKRQEQPPKEFVSEILRYSRSRPSLKTNYPAINEATIVLLSACLEGFIEQLHTEAIRQLLDERVKSSGVLEALLDYAQKQFGNPTLERIGDLFNTCNIENIISGLRIDTGEIRRFVKVRNQIAHGERPTVTGQQVEAWAELVLRFAEELSSVVGEIVSMKLES
jgi:hypothetical protein